MSYNDCENIIVPWIGETSYKNALTIVVQSHNPEIVENISEAMIDVHKRGNYRWKLGVLRCTDLEKIVTQSNITGRLGMDFVVIALDLSKIFCLERLKTSLEQVHPDLRKRRIVLVNSSGASVNQVAMNCSEILVFCKENGLDMLNANTAIREDAEFLAQKLLNYVEVSLGQRTGIPNLNI